MAGRQELKEKKLTLLRSIPSNRLTPLCIDDLQAFLPVTAYLRHDCMTTFPELMSAMVGLEIGSAWDKNMRRVG